MIIIIVTFLNKLKKIIINKFISIYYSFTFKFETIKIINYKKNKQRI